MSLVDVAREYSMSSIEEMNDLAAQSGRGAFYSQLGIGDADWEYREGACKSWPVVWEHFPAPLSVTTNFIPDHMSLGIFVSPAPSTVNGMELRSHGLMLSMPNTQVDIISRGAGDFYRIHIPQADLEKKGGDVYRALKRSMQKSPVYIGASRANTGALRSWFEDWVSAMPGQNKTAESGLASGLHEIVDVTLQPILQDLQQQPSSNKLPSNRALTKVKHLIEYFHDHPDGKLSTDAMAQLARLSKRNFYYQFRKYTGFSPQHYFNRIKLSYLHHELINGTQNVAALAAKYNFNHRGELAAFYRQVYGELPSVTLKKASARR